MIFFYAYSFFDPGLDQALVSFILDKIVFLFTLFISNRVRSDRIISVDGGK
ncbi:hypothetical protein Q757_03985 [Oenococcus alcoholitolerans]|uniref:Uncharacterized protein n=1 Tax=Oenococcus alcoholitolerans TaxID=931074 RepID=A0ABR4XRP2_9LACO|nr:hypothetical protein Q757_03985 [Oenococcus alcoholitolerans]